MPPKTDGAAPPPPGAVSPAVLRDALHRASAATDAVTDALNSLPRLLAEALAKRPPMVGDGTAAPAVDGASRVSRTAKDLRDRKMPYFWTEEPTAWFKILDTHLDTANPALSEAEKFGVLLPLLQGPAVKSILRFVKSPTPTVYTMARAALIVDFERTEEDMIAELYGLSSLGDRTAVKFLEYMRSLQPGEPDTKLFRFIFMKCLPIQVTPIVANHKELDAMATAADVIIPTLQNTATAAPAGVSAVTHPPGPLVDGLCFIHKKYGDKAYKCAAPDSCRMKKTIRRKPQRAPATSQGSDQASGNAPAGRQ